MPGGGGPGGGGSRSFGGGNMADGQFDRLLKSYNGSGDTLDYSKVPDDVRARTDSFAKITGGPPMPTSGSISRADFKVEMDKRMEGMQARMKGGGAPGGPGGPSGAPKPTEGGVVVISSDGSTSGGTTKMTVAPGGPGGGGPGGGGFSGGGGSGWGGGGGGQTAESRFKEMDKNQDGKISKEEGQQSSRLTPVFDRYDTSKDGTLDLPEYSIYYAEATGGRSNGGGSGGWGGGGGTPGAPGGPGKGGEEPEEPKPLVYRFGNLPGNLPGYFAGDNSGGDSDKDGQISLAEWVKYWDSTTTKIDEFKKLDLNTDGYVTAEEYLRANKLTAAPIAPPGKGGSKGGGNGGAPPAAETPTPTGDGTVPPASPGDQIPGGKKDDKKSDKKDDSGSKKDDKKDDKKSDKPTDTKGGYGKQPGGTDQPGSGRPPRGSSNGSGGNPFNPGGGK